MHTLGFPLWMNPQAVDELLMRGLQAGKGRGLLIPWAAWGAESISHAVIGNILLPWSGFSRREKREDSNAQGGKDQDRAGGSGKEEERGDGALCPHRAAPGHWQTKLIAPLSKDTVSSKSLEGKPTPQQ